MSASSRHSTIQSRVANSVFRVLASAVSAPFEDKGDRSRSSRWGAPCGCSAVANASPSWAISSLTGAPFPPRARSVEGDFRRPFGTMELSDLCRDIGFHPFVLRPTCEQEPDTSLWVRTTEFRTLPVANTHVEPTDIGRRCYGPAHPLRMPYGASLSFGHDSHLWLPSDQPSRAEVRSQTDVTSQPGRCSGLSPCLLGDGFPLSGPEVRIRFASLTSNQIVHARHTRCTSNRRARRPPETADRP